MPNHCYNQLSLVGNESDVTLCLDFIHGEREDNYFDVNTVIPYPKEYADKDTNSAFGDGFNSGGYEWCLANWGTKWGAYDSNIIERTEGFAVIEFSSAWSPPSPVVAKLAEKFPMLAIKLAYEEVGMDYSGFEKYDGGKLSEVEQGGYDEYPICNHEYECRSG